MNRRDFNRKILSSAISLTLFDSLFAYHAIGNRVQPILDNWLNELNTYCADLKTELISASEWQQKLGNLYQRIPLTDILETIDFNNLIKGFTYPDLGVNTKRVHFPKLDGIPEKTEFIAKVFGMKKDRAIIPHGHSNMASAHLILKGEMHLRHYEKVREEKNALIVKPSIDQISKAGDYSSISDELNNVHWFIANSAQAFTFDIIMLDLNQSNYDIQNLDMYEHDEIGDGLLKVPVLDVETALKKYGKHHH